jgi:hypothetical protein
MQIIDNFLPEEDFLEIRNQVLGVGFPWFYVDRVSASEESWIGITDPNCKETDGFFNTVINTQREYYNPLAQIFDKFFIGLERIGYKPEDMIVCRLSMKFPKNGFTSETYQLPHIDLPGKPHDSLIFYLNDSDGPTRLFEEFYDGTKQKTFKVKEAVKPVANRLLQFDGFQYHTAANPIETSRRIILNLNLHKRK